jgi:2-(1,2-epoxy-1,2-dihydrophenyl)acetyl-CoA isomerase
VSELAPEGAPVLVEIADAIATVTLNRPHTRNALNGPLIAALDRVVKEVAADPHVKVVVLTGAPAAGRVGGFCSGGDLKSGRGPGTELGVPRDALDGDLSRHDGHAAMLLHLMPKPTIAMVGGPAVGAGCSLAAACDLRFASEDAVFAANFAPNGLSGDYGGSFFWTRIVGTATARRLYLLNETLSAPEALALGMVHAVVPAPELRAHVMTVAANLTRVPREVLGLIKENLNQAEDDAERRRFLFANEAQHQVEAGRATANRRAKRGLGGE